jgi:hypothetical protein
MKKLNNLICNFKKMRAQSDDREDINKYIKKTDLLGGSKNRAGKKGQKKGKRKISPHAAPPSQLAFFLLLLSCLRTKS